MVKRCLLRPFCSTSQMSAVPKSVCHGGLSVSSSQPNVAAVRGVTRGQRFYLVILPPEAMRSSALIIWINRQHEALRALRIFSDGRTMPLSVLETTLTFTPAFLANALWLPARLTSERSNRMVSLRVSNRCTPSRAPAKFQDQYHCTIRVPRVS